MLPSINHLEYSISPSELVKEFGGSHARELGIDLSGCEGAEIQKWLLAAVLFGARISGRVAAKTFLEFDRSGLASFDKLFAAERNALVKILGRGGYARYDFKTADKLHQVGNTLFQEYGGDLNTLHRLATDQSDLARRIRQLGNGIGDVTVNIFLREMRGIWPKAQPLPSEKTVQAARALRLIDAGLDDRPHILKTLEEAARDDGIRPEDFPDFEAALVRFALASRKSSAAKR